MVLSWQKQQAQDTVEGSSEISLRWKPQDTETCIHTLAFAGPVYHPTCWTVWTSGTILQGAGCQDQAWWQISRESNTEEALCQAHLWFPHHLVRNMGHLQLKNICLTKCLILPTATGCWRVLAKFPSTNGTDEHNPASKTHQVHHLFCSPLSKAYALFLIRVTKLFDIANMEL